MAQGCKRAIVSVIVVDSISIRESGIFNTNIQISFTLNPAHNRVAGRT